MADEQDPELAAIIARGNSANAADRAAAEGELFAYFRRLAAREVGRPDVRAPLDAEIAYALWKANCGPSALAAVLGTDICPLRPLFPQFPEPGYTTLTAMRDALSRHAGGAVRWAHRRLPRRDGVLPTPVLGLVQIQWTGPWTGENGNGRWAYLFTHWIGVARLPNPPSGGGLRQWVYDVNAEPELTTGDRRCSVLAVGGGGWVQAADWKNLVVPALIEDIRRHQDRRITGGWFPLNEIEVHLP